jgi:hypothetical protein
MVNICKKILNVLYIIMEFRTIILLVIIIVFAVIIYNYISSDLNTLTGLNSGQMLQKINAADLGTNNASNFTYSIWFNIDDWNFRYGESKVIFGRMNSATNSLEPCPSVYLAETQNNIVIEMTFNESIPVKQYTITNIPIQKWVFLMISVYGRTLDVYIDGKLVRTFVLNSVPKINASSDVYVTPNGGFSGWTTRFQYAGDATNPQTAWDMYKKGYGGSLLGELFGKYSVKLSLLENEKESSSLTI